MPEPESPFRSIPIMLIDDPSLKSRFRIEDSQLEELARSIDVMGLLQPILVVVAGDRYRLVAGQRRLSACRMLGWTEIPAHVWGATPSAELYATIVENLQRTDLNPLEEAVALGEALSVSGFTHEQLAEELGIDRSTLTRKLSLLNLPDMLQEAVVMGDLPPSSALELSRIDDEDDQRYYTSMVLNHGATLNVVRDWVRAWLQYNKAPSVDTPEASPPALDVTLATPVLPSCLVCGGSPPQSPLKMVYLCWSCAQALTDAAAPSQEEGDRKGVT